MQLRLVRHLWGVDLTRDLCEYAARWRQVGYDTLEVSLRHVPDRQRFLEFLQHEGFSWVPQVFSYDFQPGGTVGQHLESLREQVQECLEHGPLFINAHTGCDAWSPAEAEDFYGQALELERQAGVRISHETHRQRYFGIPWQARHILERFPGLAVTCDLSHWVCVCERLLPNLGETIALVAQRTHHVHARVGFAEGPQVPDPAAAEYAAELAAHEGWWDQVWQAQRQRGFAESTLTPEFGPAPYMHVLPHTRVPLADLAAICDWMARRQREHFGEKYAK